MSIDKEKIYEYICSILNWKIEKGKEITTIDRETLYNIIQQIIEIK